MTAHGPDGAVVRRLTVLFDPECGLCAHLKGWLERQHKLVPMDLVPVGSAQARTLFPDLDHAATLRKITVIGDGGQVFTDDAAFVVCLWALADHRAKAHWLAGPAGASFARAAVIAAAKYRTATGATHRWLDEVPGQTGPPPSAPCDDRCAPPH
ncbi:thiol-disulfide oxidoreductase DCC family protein [Streptomyces sp. NPDC003860]